MTIADADYLLRLPEVGDFRAWTGLRSQSRGFLEPWEPLVAQRRHDRERLSRPGGAQRTGISCGHAVPLLLFSRQNRTLLGGLTIGHIRRGAAQSCMIGYWMGEPHAGKGHMSAAVGLVVPYIFSVLRLHRIEAACIPENARSIRLLEKAGFEQEGYLRKYLKINGQWRDHLLFSRLAPSDGPTEV